LPGLFFWNSSLLEVRNLSKFFGGIHAVDDASLTIEQGSITGLIGPNGAGKTTLFNVISGLYRPDAGQVYFDGQNITGKAPHELLVTASCGRFKSHMSSLP